jgi:hypothetical protein
MVRLPCIWVETVRNVARHEAGSHQSARIRSRRLAPNLLRTAGAFALGMTRTIWFALFCVVGLGAAMAIRMAGPIATSVAAPTADESNTEPAAVPNELTKSDRLPLPSAPVETEASLPPAMATAQIPAEIPPPVPETIKKVEDRHWQDANARIVPTESSRRHARKSEPRKSGGTTASNAKTEVWHCRRDAMGSLLRSLDLSPRCDL